MILACDETQAYPLIISNRMNSLFFPTFQTAVIFNGQLLQHWVFADEQLGTVVVMRPGLDEKISMAIWYGTVNIVMNSEQRRSHLSRFWDRVADEDLSFLTQYREELNIWGIEEH